MRLQRFEALVARVLDELPPEFKAHLANVIIEVRRRPTRAQRKEMRLGGGQVLLGLYQGVPLTERPHDYGGMMPDHITIFQEPIEDGCRSEADVERVVRTTLVHELGHYFGLDDKRLEELGYG